MLWGFLLPARVPLAGELEPLTPQGYLHSKDIPPISLLLVASLYLITKDFYSASLQVVLDEWR